MSDLMGVRVHTRVQRECIHARAACLLLACLLSTSGSVLLTGCDLEEPDGDLAETRSTHFTGSLNGDVTGTQNSTQVAFVGGSTASNLHAAEVLANAGTSTNTANTLVKRDAHGNFMAGTITATYLATSGTDVKIGVNAAPLSADLNNVAIGYQPLENAISASNNVAVGSGALQYYTAGQNGLALGSNAQRYIAAGSDNVAVGAEALRGDPNNGINGGLNNASHNIAIGTSALSHITTGVGNTAIGSRAGYLGLSPLKTGEYNTLIGYNSGVSGGSLSHATVIGAFATVSTPNTIVLGEVGVDKVVIGATGSSGSEVLQVTGDIKASGNVISNGTTLTSDFRFKRDIQTLEKSLEKILQLRGVSFRWRTEEFPERHFDSRTQIGVIAQEIERTFPEAVISDQSGYKSVNYSALVSPLIEAIKGLNERIDEVSSENAALRRENSKIKAYLCVKDVKASFCK